MSVFNDEINLEVLKFALKRYPDCIPKLELQTLQNHILAWKDQEPNAKQNLCRFVFESESIDHAYDQALMDLRRQYKTQQKAKSAILTVQSQNELNGLGTIADKLIQQLDRLLNPARSRTDQSTSSVWENADRIAIMASGGAFLGGAIVQLFGGGVTQFIGVLIGAIVGAYSGWKVGPSEPSRKS